MLSGTGVDSILKGDYEGAMQKFSSLAVVKRRRHRGGNDSATVEKARYWMAMSLMRMQRFEEARQIFQTIAKDSSYGYYSILANYRLEILPATPAAPVKGAAQSVLAVAKTETNDSANPDVPAAADDETESNSSPTIVKSTGHNLMTQKNLTRVQIT